MVKVLTVIDSLEVGTPGQLLPTLAKAASSEQVELEVVSLQPLVRKVGHDHTALGRAGHQAQFSRHSEDFGSAVSAASRRCHPRVAL